MKTLLPQSTDVLPAPNMVGRATPCAPPSANPRTQTLLDRSATVCGRGGTSRSNVNHQHAQFSPNAVAASSFSPLRSGRQGRGENSPIQLAHCAPEPERGCVVASGHQPQERDHSGGLIFFENRDRSSLSHCIAPKRSEGGRMGEGRGEGWVYGKEAPGNAGKIPRPSTLDPSLDFGCWILDAQSVKSRPIGVRCSLALCLATALLLLPSLTATAADESRLSDYVRPFVGTAGAEGNTFPGPSAPFGMMQLSPDTFSCLTNWGTCSGYSYDDPTILGFSLTHLTGTGCPDLGDFLFVPQAGRPAINPGDPAQPESGYQSAYSHTDESASAGYYKVKLLKSGVITELTAGDRAGILRFTFPATDVASVMIDLNHIIGPWHIAQSRVRIEDNSTVTGFHLNNGWAKERYLYFAARFSRPFDGTQIISSGQPVVYNTYRFRSRNEAAGTNLQFIAGFKNTKAGDVVQVKVAVSAVSAADALQNLDSEIPHWDFEKVREATRAKWDRELSKVQIEGSQAQKETFYTSLYHAMLAPNLYQDVNGKYRGFDQNIHEAKDFTRYCVFSLWDTFRAEHPLLALIQEKRDADMINALLAHYDESVDHLLPMWELQGNETWCMIGYHAVPVIVDGYLKGVKGFDAQRAYDAIKTTAMSPDYDSAATYAKLGWVPCDKEDESLSKTLEYAYDDWCIAQMAKALGKTDDYNYFMKRSASYKNIYDPTIGWMRSKDSNGNWRTPFDPHVFGGGFRMDDVTEGTSSEYSWFVPQDVPGLIQLMGGNQKFVEKLDSLFDDQPSKVFTTELSANDQRGCIGEYWHGNEPSHHVIYLYCYAGQPAKAAERLHKIVSTQYGNQPGSLCGNDDCGQMSAWYLFTCMGFYPVCPGSDYYVLGAPQIPKAVMHLSNGNDVTMTAKNLSDKNIYVQSVKLNGKNWDSPFLPYNQLKSGATLEFTMGPQPSQWATSTVQPSSQFSSK